MNSKSLSIIENWNRLGKEIYYDQYNRGTEVEMWAKYPQAIYTKWFTNKDLRDITYRTINYWDEKGYLTGEKNSAGKWRKFDFIQLVWIQVLDSLRKMGVSIDVIVPAIFQALGYIQESSEEEKMKLLDGLSEEQQNTISNMYGNYMNFQTTFRFYVLYAIFLKKEVSIRYYSDGSCAIVKGITKDSDSKAIKDFIQKNSGSHIAISLNEIIKQFIAEKDIEQIENVSVLSENELELLQHLRKKDVTEVRVFLEEGEPIRLDVKDTMEDESMNKRVYEYLFSPYQKIEFKTKGGKTAYFERITTYKLNKTKS